MVKKLKTWLAKVDLRAGGEWLHLGLLCIVAVMSVAMFIVGCTKKQTAKVAEAVPVNAAGYAEDEDFEPDFVCLRPGQSAELLEDVEVRARIPYRRDGDSGSAELWTGRVLIEKGTMLVKPRVE